MEERSAFNLCFGIIDTIVGLMDETGDLQTSQFSHLRHLPPIMIETLLHFCGKMKTNNVTTSNINLSELLKRRDPDRRTAK